MLQKISEKTSTFRQMNKSLAADFLSRKLAMIAPSGELSLCKKEVFFLVSLTLLLVLFPLILAAGGGGGGGSFLRDLSCDTAGSLSFSQAPQTKPVNISLPSGVLFANVPGEWVGKTFTSEEGLFMEAGTYTVLDNINGNKTVDCPGFIFSCKFVKIGVESCELDQGKVVGEFTLENESVEDIKIQFTLPGKYVGTTQVVTHTQQSKSAELKDLQVKKQKDSYRLEIPSLPGAKSLQVSHPQCVGKYYRYATLDCTDKQEAQKAAAKYGEQFKCGGYLEIEDRVRCRVRLGEDQRGEFENFFPEECRSWKNPEQCVKLYQKVQKCWDQEKPSRIACLRQKSGVLNVQQQKAACGEDKACREKLRTDTFTLTKLRLYHLEEEAEELEEQGKITEDQLVDFVVQMEESKLAFNQAQSKEERKQVILQARKHWIELIRKVKV